MSYTLCIRSIQNVAFDFSVGRNPSFEFKLNHALYVCKSVSLDNLWKYSTRITVKHEFKNFKDIV